MLKIIWKCKRLAIALWSGIETIDGLNRMTYNYSIYDKNDFVSANNISRQILTISPEVLFTYC